jgi:adenylate cyclase
MEFTHPRDRAPRDRIRLGAIAELLTAALPLIGLISLLLRSQLDPHLENYRLHFILFGLVGALAFALGYAAGEAAKRRGDARVLLLSIAFMATGGFMGLHALGTPGVLFTADHAGFKVAIPVGLLVSAVFAAGSAFVDLSPSFPPLVIRNQKYLRAAVLLAMGSWFLWTVTNLPPLGGPDSEAARGSLLTVFAIVGTLVYALSAARYWEIFRARPNLLPAAVIACFVLLSEALIGVAFTGERKWHASWWEWHGLIVTAFLIIGVAARREWREERFGDLYLSSTRERSQNVTVVFSDLAGYTRFAARSTPAEAAAVLETYWRTASMLLTRRFGGVVEKFIGDGVVAVFNRGGDQPDHARRAACAALALRDAFGRFAADHPEWPRMRVGVNSGEAIVREIGGEGLLAYPLVGDTINMGARLEGLAPVGGVLIGVETYEQLPDGAVVEARCGLQVKGKDEAVDAFVLHACPC